MRLSPEGEARIERELAAELLEIHKPLSTPTAGDTDPPTEPRIVCRWCLVTWPCARAQWAHKRLPPAPSPGPPPQ